MSRTGSNVVAFAGLATLAVGACLIYFDRGLSDLVVGFSLLLGGLALLILGASGQQAE